MKSYRKWNRKNRNQHHLVPRSRGGGTYRQNLLLIDIDRHKAWHELFGNMTAEEALDLLTRTVQAKKGQGHVRRKSLLLPLQSYRRTFRPEGDEAGAYSLPQSVSS